MEGTGNSRFRLVAPAAIREASALILVADVRQPSVMDSLQNWMAVVHRHAPLGAPLAFVGWLEVNHHEDKKEVRNLVKKDKVLVVVVLNILVGAYPGRRIEWHFLSNLVRFQLSLRPLPFSHHH